MNALNVFLFEGVGGVGKSTEIERLVKLLGDDKTHATHFPIKPFSADRYDLSESQKSLYYFSEQLGKFREEVERLTKNNDEGVDNKTSLLFDRGFLSSAVYHFDEVDSVRIASIYTSMLIHHIEHIINYYNVEVAFHIVFLDVDIEDVMKSKIARIRATDPDISADALSRKIKDSRSRAVDLIEKYDSAFATVESFIQDNPPRSSGWYFNKMTAHRIKKKMFNYGENQTDFESADHAGVPRIFHTKQDLISHNAWVMHQLVSNLIKENQ